MTELDLDLERFDEMRRFYVVGLEDEGADVASGLVACGVVFPEPSGRVVMGWLSGPGSVEVFESVDALLERHDRDGETEVVFPTDA